MRLKELADLQFQYSILERTKMTKKALCDLIIPFRDKYALTDGQALRIARRELPLFQIEKLMRNKEHTNADRIRCWNNHELAETIANFVSEIDNGDARYSDDPNDWLEWLQQPAEVTNG